MCWWVHFLKPGVAARMQESDLSAQHRQSRARLRARAAGPRVGGGASPSTRRSAPAPAAAGGRRRRPDEWSVME